MPLPEHVPSLAQVHRPNRKCRALCQRKVPTENAVPVPYLPAMPSPPLQCRIINVSAVRGRHGIIIIFCPYVPCPVSAQSPNRKCRARAVFTGNAKSAPSVPYHQRQCSAGAPRHNHNLLSVCAVSCVSAKSQPKMPCPCRVYRQCQVRPFSAVSSTSVQCGGARGISIIFCKLPVHTAPFPFTFIIFCNSAVHTTQSQSSLNLRCHTA